MKIQSIVRAMLKGFIDSFRGAITLFNIDKQLNEQLYKSQEKSAANAQKKESGIGTSPAKSLKHLKESHVIKTTFQCCMWNTGLCCFGIAAFEYVILPSIYYALSSIIGISYDYWSGYIRPSLMGVFGTVYILPVFVGCRIVNCIWFQDIAESAHRYRKERSVALTSISKFIADMMFSMLVQAMFLGQGFLMTKLPLSPIGDILGLIHLCLLYALYAFEYKWCNMGWELHRRLTFIEHNWPYFIGFGLPLAVLTQLTDSIMFSSCIFSVLFPLFIVSGNEADPVTDACDGPLKLFSLVVAISNTLFNQAIGSKKR